MIDSFSFLISTVEPILSKKFLTFLFGGQIGTGPFFKDIGGRGIALTIVDFTLIFFLSSERFIVEIKLIIVWLVLNFKFLIIFSPTFGVMDKKTQFALLIISWLFFAIIILLNFFLNS